MISLNKIFVFMALISMSNALECPVSDAQTSTLTNAKCSILKNEKLVKDSAKSITFQIECEDSCLDDLVQEVVKTCSEDNTEVDSSASSCAVKASDDDVVDTPAPSDGSDDDDNDSTPAPSDGSDDDDKDSTPAPSGSISDDDSAVDAAEDDDAAASNDDAGGSGATEDDDTASPTSNDDDSASPAVFALGALPSFICAALAFVW